MEEDNRSTGSVPSSSYYYIGETNLELGEPGGKSVWSVQIIKLENGQLKNDEDVSGVEVFGQLKDEKGVVSLSGKTESDGWVRWTTDYPKVGTKLFITEIKGKLPWFPQDKQFASTRSAAAHLSNTRGY